MSDLIPACFSSSNNFNLLHNSSGSHEKKIVFGIPEAEAVMDGDLSNFVKDLSLTVTFSSFMPNTKFHFFSKLKNSFLILWGSMVNIEIIICHCF